MAGRDPVRPEQGDRPVTVSMADAATGPAVRRTSRRVVYRRGHAVGADSRYVNGDRRLGSRRGGLMVRSVTVRLVAVQTAVLVLFMAALGFTSTAV